MSLQSLKTVCSGQDSDSDHSNPGKEGFYELFKSGSMVYLESIILVLSVGQAALDKY